MGDFAGWLGFLFLCGVGIIQFVWFPVFGVWGFGALRLRFCVFWIDWYFYA